MINYQELCNRCNLDLNMSTRPDGTEIGRILDEISECEHRDNRPLLSAVVINKELGRPGEGFYTLARDLGICTITEDKDEFWLDELKRVYDYWNSSKN